MITVYLIGVVISLITTIFCIFLQVCSGSDFTIDDLLMGLSLTITSWIGLAIYIIVSADWLIRNKNLVLIKGKKK